MTEQEELIARLKGAFSGHELIEITVSMTVFSRQPPAKTLMAVKISDTWALHPSLDWPGWACTHIPTGQCVGGYWASIDRALIGLGAIVATGISWETITSNEDTHRIYSEHPEMQAALNRGLTAAKALGNV